MNAHLRARALSEWRGYTEPVTRPDRVVSVSDQVERLMRSLGLGERLREEEVLKAWTEIAGEFIARHAQPTHLQNGVLLVVLLQPTMHYELDRVQKPRILRKLRDRFGSRTVRDIRFRIGG